MRGLLQHRIAARTATVRWQSSSSRGWNGQSTKLRPVINGQRVAFHVNDLKPQATTRYASDLVVVLDLDECLIHARDVPQNLTHQVSRHGSSSSSSSVDSFTFHLDHLPLQVNLRPGLLDFLEQVTQTYETHIFTAGMKVYATPILDELSNRLGHTDIFRGRWFRDSCTPLHAGSYSKDLSRFPDLNRTLLVDNNPISFMLQPENGLLVEHYYDCPEDRELERVWETIQSLDPLEDVRGPLASLMAEKLEASPYEKLFPTLFAEPRRVAL